jgi:uncharacterized membrane protein
VSELLAALTVFMAAHMIPAVPAVRSRLVAWLGRRAYLALYSLLSVALLGWLVVAAQRAETVVLWIPAPWQAWVPALLMPLALFLVIAGLATPNPLSVSLRPTSGMSLPGSIVAVTRHPVLWGFLIWAVSHVPPNGDLSALILFGSMALFAAAGMVILDARARKRLGADEWTRLAGETLAIPFLAIIAGRDRLRIDHSLLIAAFLSIALYLWLFLWGHQELIGVDPAAWLFS